MGKGYTQTLQPSQYEDINNTPEGQKCGGLWHVNRKNQCMGMGWHNI